MEADSAPRVLDAVFREVKAVPGATAIARVETVGSANTRFARREINSTGESDSHMLSVGVSLGKRHGAATTSQLDAASVKQAVARAARLARLAPEDLEHMPPLGAQRYARTPSAFDPALARFDPVARADIVAAAIDAAGTDVDVAGFTFGEARRLTLGTSAGLRAAGAVTSTFLALTARTLDGTGSGWANGWSQRAGRIDGAALARTAAEKARRSQNPRKLEPGRYTVVLEPAAVSSMVGFLAAELVARAAEEGRSFFSKASGGTRVGEKLFDDAVTLVSDPSNPELPGLPFDDEGLPRAPITWIDRGSLANLRTSRYWAQKTGRTPTAEPHEYVLRGGSAASVEELVRGTKRGLLVTRLWYTRWVDRQSLLVTGLTRDGTFLIENGELVAPVNNFRWNESPAAMLRNIEAMTSATVRTAGGELRNMRVPAVRVADFNMTSISEAV
jgi:predicted Zn-dependent protease